IFYRVDVNSSVHCRSNNFPVSTSGRIFYLTLHYIKSVSRIYPELRIVYITAFGRVHIEHHDILRTQFYRAYGLLCDRELYRARHKGHREKSLHMTYSRAKRSRRCSTSPTSIYRKGWITRGADISTSDFDITRAVCRERTDAIIAICIG